MYRHFKRLYLYLKNIRHSLTKRISLCSSFKALSTDTIFIKIGLCYQKLSTLEFNFHYRLSSHCLSLCCDMTLLVVIWIFMTSSGYIKHQRDIHALVPGHVSNIKGKHMPSVLAYVCVFIITQLVYLLYIVFSHTTTFEDSAIFDSSYLTVSSCPCDFVVDPVLINHVMLLKVTGYSLFIT